MFKKSFYIFIDFYKSIKIKELFECVILPLFFTLLTFYIQNTNLSLKNLDLDYKNSFNDSILTITSFLIALSICAITLLFSSSGKNIENAKNKITENRKNHENEKISYFQLIQIRSYYNVILEFLLIILTIIYKLLSNGFNLDVLFYINLFLIIHILFVLCFVVIHMFHLSWKNE